MQYELPTLALCLKDKRLQVNVIYCNDCLEEMEE